MPKQDFSISLLVNANKTFDRQLIQGIGDYLRLAQCSWDLYIEEDFRCRLNNVHAWAVDGIIADMDDPEIARSLAGVTIPVVGFGGSYHDPAQYPEQPYVASDNVAVVEAAYQHLKAKGLQYFAFYGLPPAERCRWAHERELAFVERVRSEGFSCTVFRGEPTAGDRWHYSQNRLADWLQNLPRGTGVLAVTDARARHLLQLCERLNLLVPEQIAIIGIDDEEMVQSLVRTPLSSVRQGCQQMGYLAARMLHRQMQGLPLAKDHPLVGPDAVLERASSDYQPLSDPYVMQALHYIRHHACKGVKSEQVCDFVGISRSNLERRFKAVCGHSIHFALHHTRLERAKSLLDEGKLATAEIARLSGYPSVQYLYNVFKKDLGMTPKDYREQQSQVA
ncbi:XylR family transcriptional regulator [Ferrimonas marina]|uniref:LacI family transcriptional regulator n=1 Tax=Ferrimonas marina TaxID=299255 RepID=A0A1M5NDE4_9GAMM|nr:DNA-binding transcriptional regulator [Ferrimonas marina]SHG87531.1 LacI family transcriptional regulator [Ferrimonas marina]